MYQYPIQFVLIDLKQRLVNGGYDEMQEKRDKPIYKNDIRINNIQGVNRLLQRVINKLIQGEISIEKAKAIGYLSNISLKGLEMELEQRVIEVNNNNEEELAEVWANAVIELAERRRV